jgi:hypothetical protein
MAERDVKPIADVYLAVFVLEVEPVEACVASSDGFD